MPPGVIRLVWLRSTVRRGVRIAFNVVAQRAEYKIRSRVFFDDFPNLVLWVRDVPASGGGWNGVFTTFAGRA